MPPGGRPMPVRRAADASEKEYQSRSPPGKSGAVSVVVPVLTAEVTVAA